MHPMQQRNYNDALDYLTEKAETNGDDEFCQWFVHIHIPKVIYIQPRIMWQNSTRNGKRRMGRRRFQCFRKMNLERWDSYVFNHGSRIYNRIYKIHLCWEDSDISLIKYSVTPTSFGVVVLGDLPPIIIHAFPSVIRTFSRSLWLSQCSNSPNASCSVTHFWRISRVSSPGSNQTSLILRVLPYITLIVVHTLSCFGHTFCVP